MPVTVETFGRVRSLTCCCCGGPAPATAQWSNRDTGFGMCGRCIDWLRTRGVPEAEIVFLYGHEGTHWLAEGARG